MRIAKRHDESSAERVRHLPLITGHAAWNDLRSIAPLGAILWNNTAAAAATKVRTAQQLKPRQTVKLEAVMTHGQLRRLPVEHGFCRATQEQPLAVAQPDSRDAGWRGLCRACACSAAKPAAHSPSPFLGLTAKCLRAHSLNPLFSPPGAGMSGNVCSQQSTQKSRHQVTVSAASSCGRACDVHLGLWCVGA
jgi:hypothetical protein